MEEENKKKFEPFDDWLTRALRARSQAEARPGLEGRILARLASEPDSTPQRRWKWMPALAVAFGLLLIVVVGYQFLRIRAHSHQQQAGMPQPTREARSLSPVPEAPDIQISKGRGNAQRHALPVRAQNISRPVIVKSNALPKQDKFPAEAPATEQERLMAEIQRRQAAASFAQYARDFREGKDLAIENNFIPPLAPETADDNPNR